MSEMQTAFDRCIAELDNIQGGLNEIEASLSTIGRKMRDIDAAIDSLKLRTIMFGFITFLAIPLIVLAALAIGWSI